MDINVIGVPLFYGSDRFGAHLGQNKLREKDIISKLQKLNHNVYDLGDVYVSQVETDNKLSVNERMKYFKPILETNRNLAHKVSMCLSTNSFPLIIGGDHSLSIGSISGVSKHFENIGVVWMDAHGDFNTEETSSSKNVHGMPLAILSGYGNDEFVNLYYDGPKIKTENIFHIGGRDFDLEEEKLFKSTNANIYSPDTINTKGVDFIVEDILAKAKEQNIDALHISFDIDFMDADIVPGTGTRVSNGFSNDMAKEIISKLFESNLVCSMDVVELNPLLDVEDTTTNITLDILESVFA